MSQVEHHQGRGPEGKAEPLLPPPAVQLMEEARQVLVFLGARWKLEPEKEVEVQCL